jgi:hypothetical protein
MRKVLFSLIFVLSALISLGQTIYTVKNVDALFDVKLDINRNKTFFQLNGGATQTVSQDDSTWTYTFCVDNLYDALKGYGKMDLDSLAGTPSVTVTLEAKYFYDDASWTTVLTKTWAGTTGDTTLIFDNSSAKAYRFFRFNVNPDISLDTTQVFDIGQIQYQLYK